MVGDRGGPELEEGGSRDLLQAGQQHQGNLLQLAGKLHQAKS